MFSKEESKKIRQEFWTSFGKSYPRNWILFNTTIKELSFKFHFDTKEAYVSLDVDGKLEKRITYWAKLLRLRSILISDFLPNTKFEENHLLENGKEISRIFVPLQQKVSIHNKNTWRETMEFFYENMIKFENFFFRSIKM